MLMSDEEVTALLVVEEQIVEKMATLHAQHQAIQETAYDADPRQLRSFLDTWMDWHLWASDYLVRLKQVRWKAQVDLDTAWQKAHTSTRDIEIAAMMPHYGAYQEREVFYTIKTREVRRTVEVLDRLIGVTYDFLSVLKALQTHWDKRRVDTKWEIDRISQIPGSDYRS